MTLALIIAQFVASCKPAGVPVVPWVWTNVMGRVSDETSDFMKFYLVHAEGALSQEKVIEACTDLGWPPPQIRTLYSFTELKMVVDQYTNGLVSFAELILAISRVHPHQLNAVEDYMRLPPVVCNKVDLTDWDSCVNDKINYDWYIVNSDPAVA